MNGRGDPDEQEGAAGDEAVEEVSLADAPNVSEVGVTIVKTTRKAAGGEVCTFSVAAEGRTYLIDGGQPEAEEKLKEILEEME